jgi:hypothetical protein
MSKYIVIKEFADKDCFSKHYVPGDELPGTFSEERLANIVRLRLAKVEEDEPLSDIDLSEKVAELLPKIKGLKDVEKLKEYLEMEKAASEPRKMIVKTIEDCLAALLKE